MKILYNKIAVVKSLQRRTFFFPSDLFSNVKNFKEKKMLPYNPHKLYAIVSDVDKYKYFVPFCLDSRVNKNSIKSWMSPDKEKIINFNADLEIGFSGLNESFLSEVYCVEPFKVTAVCEGNHLFNTLRTSWNFIPAHNNQHTIVSFEVQFSFKSVAYSHLSQIFFDKICKDMINAFEKRAHQTS